MATKVSKKQGNVNHWFILVLLALAQFMVVLDNSIVNVALPAVQHVFKMTPSSLQWIVTAYTLTFGGFLLLGGRAADLFGRRRLFLIGTVLFTVASLADGLSQSGSQLVIFRALQGIAGAMMSPAALSIVLVTYRQGHERNVALSVWGAVASGGAAAGVLLGGILTQYLDWRWNFFVNVPVGILVVVASLMVLDKHESTVEHNNLDLPGAVLVTGGLVSLVYGLVKAPSDGWTSHAALTFFAIAIVGLVGFVINEARAKHPLTPLSIFKIRNLSGANLMILCMTAGMFSVFFFSTLYLQEVLGFSPVKTGLSFLIVPVVVALAATNVPRVVKKVGYRPILMVAPLLVSGALFWLHFLPVNGTYWGNMAPALILMGLGMGATFVAVNIAATDGVPHNEAGLASGILNTSQQIGGAIGLAVLSGLAASATTRYITHHAALGKAVQLSAQVHGYDTGFLVASTFGIVASLIAVFVLHHAKGGASDGTAAAPVHMG